MMVPGLAEGSPPNGFLTRSTANGWLEIFVGQSMTVSDRGLLMTA
jgi:hypothetical protein